MTHSLRHCLLLRMVQGRGVGALSCQGLRAMDTVGTVWCVVHTHPQILLEEAAVQHLRQSCTESCIPLLK